MKLAVIPARGGSERIPRKNIRPFCGKPMIGWSIECALGAGLFDWVIVSTDDQEIAEIATRYGAEVPFIRPAALADGFTTTADVMAHATTWAVDTKLAPDAVCCIYATAPFLDRHDLARGLELLDSGPWSFVFAATEFAAPVFRSFVQREDGGIEMLFPEHFPTRSQDLPRVLHDAGQFYWGRPEAWTEKRRIFDRRSTPVLIPRMRVYDIDEPADWTIAEAAFRQQRGQTA